MNKMINELVEMAQEGYKKVLIAYNKKNGLDIYEPYQVDYIPKDYQLGLLDLEAYSTYKEIKEEIECMILNDDDIPF